MNDISFSILGRPFYAENIPDFLEHWLEKNWHFPEHSVPEFPYQITLKVLNEAPKLGKGGLRKSEADINDEVFWWRKDENKWWFQEGDSGIQFILEPDTFNISLWGLNKDRQLKRIITALYLALIESVRASGLFPLHASVAIKDGVTPAYTGESGMGKSTTLVKAMVDHAVPLAEDFSWLDPQTTIIYGWDHGLRFWEDGWGKLPLKFKKMDWQEDVDGKMILPWDKLNIERTVETRLDHLVVLKRAPEKNGAPGMQSIPPHQAVRVLWEATGIPLTEFTKKEVSKGIGQLISHVEVAELYI